MKSKAIYEYSAAGEYTGEGVAYEDPRQPGRFALPAHSTETPPPEVKPGEVAVYVLENEAEEGAWQVKSDHRGETAYDTTTGDPLTIDYIGSIKPEHTTTPPGRFQEWDGSKWRDRSLTSEEKITVIEEESRKIDAETQSKIDQGFEYDGKVFSMSLSAQSNWLYLLTLFNGGQFPDEGFSIATKDDAEYLLSKDKAPEFFQAGATAKETALAEGRKRKHELKESYAG